MKSERWNLHFLELAEVCAKMSKDPNTQAGAVIVGPDREIRSTGFNGFPRGIEDSRERLTDRETKLKIIVHAEMNAILNAARFGVSLKGCTLYFAATDHTGLVWGGPPCTRCTVEIIQSGIQTIVSRPKKSVPSRWHDDLALAQQLLEEAGIDYREVAIMKERAERQPAGDAPAQEPAVPASDATAEAYYAARIAAHGVTGGSMSPNDRVFMAAALRDYSARLRETAQRVAIDKEYAPDELEDLTDTFAQAESELLPGVKP